MAQELIAGKAFAGVDMSFLNEVPEHMAQEYRMELARDRARPVLNEVPEHMAQESWCRNTARGAPALLNEVPEHMAQE